MNVLRIERQDLESTVAYLHALRWILQQIPLTSEQIEQLRDRPDDPCRRVLALLEYGPEVGPRAIAGNVAALDRRLRTILAIGHLEDEEGGLR
jgi:hypothetical protein